MTWQAAAILSDQDYATALMLGCGNLGRGLRIAIQFAGGRLGEVAKIPSTRLEAEDMIRPARTRIAQLVSKALGLLIRAPKPAGTQSKAVHDQRLVNEWDDVS